MELTAAQEALFGLVLPPILSVLNQSGWSKRVQSIVALAGCLAATVLVNLQQGEPVTLAGVSSMLVTAFVAYKAFYEPTGLAGFIEEKTSFAESPELEEEEPDYAGQMVEKIRQMPIAPGEVIIPIVVARDMIPALHAGIECTDFQIALEDGRQTLRWKVMVEPKVDPVDEVSSDGPEDSMPVPFEGLPEAPETPPHPNDSLPR